MTDQGSIAHQLKAEAAPHLVRIGAERHKAGDHVNAREMFLGALSADFGCVPAWQGLGSLALGPARYEAAIALCRRALALSPNDPGLMANLGNALCRAQRFAEAEVLLTKARELAPDTLCPHYNLGLVYYCTGRADLAEASFGRANEIGPDSPGLRGDLAHAVLKTGDLSRGLDLLEVRWEGLLAKNPIWDCGLPKWNGENIGGPSHCSVSADLGGTLLLHHEQGYGDTIQFVRFIPAIRAHANAMKVIFACPKPLHRMLAGQCGIDEIIDDQAPGAIVKAAREADYHCPLVSAVAVLKPMYAKHPWQKNVRGIANVVASVANTPYLFVPGESKCLFRAGGAALSVGLCWGAAATPERGPQKSVPLEELLALGSIPDVKFWSLQYGPQVDDLHRTAGDNLIATVPGGVGDFADTANVMNGLDLIVSIDTSAAHLAGAIGRPVFMLNPITPCWRWVHGPKPWYDSMTIFDQTDPDNWREPIEDIAEAIKWMAAERRAKMADAA